MADSLRKCLITSLLGILLLGTGCAIRIGDFEVQVGDPEMLEVGELRREEQIVPMEAIESAQVEVQMGAGKLKLSGGAETLLEAQFIYNVEEWQPEVRFEKVDQLGTLVVKQPLMGTLQASNVRYEWELKFNDQIPLAMLVQLGAGEATIDLRGLNLKDLEVELGAGKVTIDLNGEWDRSFDVQVTRGVGEAAWRLPTDVAVRIDVKSALGTVAGLGLTRQGEFFVNEVYGDSDVVINIEVLGAIGAINLEVVE